MMIHQDYCMLLTHSLQYVYTNIIFKLGKFGEKQNEGNKENLEKTKKSKNKENIWRKNWKIAENAKMKGGSEVIKLRKF